MVLTEALKTLIFVSFLMGDFHIVLSQLRALQD